MDQTFEAFPWKVCILSAFALQVQTLQQITFDCFSLFSSDAGKDAL